MKLSPELIQRLPKTDLHLHLDGSLRPQTLIELARRQQVELPSFTEEGLYELIFKENYASLTEYLKGFQYTVAVLQDEEALEQTAYELMEDNIREGVRYIEVRFAPQLHVHTGLTFQSVMQAVNRGLERAASRYNRASQAIREGREPRYAYGIIACAMRKFEPYYSDFYKRIFDIHSFSSAKEVFKLASLELVRAMIDVRDRYGVPVVGFDLAGDEAGYPAMDFEEAYDFAHRHFMKKTVHAGEAYGPESIFQAISYLHADRIGHGSYLFSPEMIQSEEITDPARYIERLANFIAERRITIEVCLSSNLQTNPRLGDLSRHAFGRMMAHNLSCTICTDNRLVSRTTVSREWQLALEHFPIAFKDLRNLLIYGFKRNFFPGPYLEKRQYVRQAIDFIDQFEPVIQAEVGS